MHPLPPLRSAEPLPATPALGGHGVATPVVEARPCGHHAYMVRAIVAWLSVFSSNALDCLGMLVDQPGQIWALLYHSFHDIQRASELFATNATKVIEDLNAASRYSHVFIN